MYDCLSWEEEETQAGSWAKELEDASWVLKGTENVRLNSEHVRLKREQLLGRC